MYQVDRSMHGFLSTPHLPLKKTVSQSDYYADGICISLSRIAGVRCAVSVVPAQYSILLVRYSHCLTRIKYSKNKIGVNFTDTPPSMMFVIRVKMLVPAVALLFVAFVFVRTIKAREYIDNVDEHLLRENHDSCNCYRVEHKGRKTCFCPSVRLN